MVSRVSLALILLLLGTAAVYAPVSGFEFVHYDDPLYVSENERVRSGLSVDNVRWALTTPAAANWHPVTWLSHMIDVEVFGPDAAGAHHLVNVALHLLNITLVFLFFRRFLSAEATLFVAGMFALHPLHVESVAWVSERKDLLSTTWWLSSWITYARFAAGDGRRYWWLTLGLLAVGLMAKPMLVTTPFLFLLMDYWPLRRLSRDSWRIRVAEKLPMLGLVIASSVVTFLVQDQGGAMATQPWGHRLANAVVAYVRYLGKIAWPWNLAPLYPNHVGMWAIWQVGTAMGALVVATIGIWRAGRTARVGWLWFLGTLVPVLGLVQVGRQSMADRYTYVPMLGISIVLVALASHVLVRRPKLRVWIRSLAGVAIAAWGFLTFQQVGIWRDSFTLFRTTLDRTVDNDVMENNLGAALLARGRTTEALPHFRRSLAIHPDGDAHRNLARALLSLGRWAEAVPNFESSLRYSPGHAPTHNDLGLALRRLGRRDEAMAHFEIAIRLNPQLASAWNNLGTALGDGGDFRAAANGFARAVAIDPNYAKAHQNLGLALHNLGRTEEAVHHLRRAVVLDPTQTQAQELLRQLGG